MDLILDFDVNGWTLDERMDFEEVVTTMTVEQAVGLIGKAGVADDATDEQRSEAMDAMFAIPSRVRAAFVWIAARRNDPGLSFADAAKTFTGQDFYDAIQPDGGEADTAPLPETPATTTAKSSVRSASTSSTPRRKSAV